MKNLVQSIPYPGINDIIHPDGSKTYDTCRGPITIQRKVVVDFVEGILSSNFVGWGYMPLLDQAKGEGIITREEYLDICNILD
jgi:hypothetical protein